MNKVVRFNERGILELKGKDRGTFLQGLISNDVEKLTPEHAVYAALLSPQGKYLFDFFLSVHDDSILLDVDAERIGDLAKRLTIYRLRADVTIQDNSDEWAVAALIDTPDSLPKDIAGACRALLGGVVFVDPRSPKLGSRAIVPMAKWPTLVSILDCEESDINYYEKRRIYLGVPDGKLDLLPDKTFLMEAHFEALNGIDFNKGCYIGQELTARTKYRANLKRHFYSLQFEGPALPAEAPIFLEGKEAGVVRSSIAGYSLAYMRDEDVARANEHGLPLTVGNLEVKARDPEFF